MGYYVLKCNIKSADLNEENYGIVLIYDDNNRKYFCNISDNITDVELLVSKMNNYNIESIQAAEIIEDFKFNNKYKMRT